MNGIRFNITLSEEQIDEIASRSADKVAATKNVIRNNEIWLQEEIDRLNYKVKTRDELLVKKELQLDMMTKRVKYYKEKVKQWEENH